MEYIYAALLLHKLGKEVNEHNVKGIVTASGAHADESKIKSLIVSLKDVDIDKELEGASLMTAAPTGGPAVHKEEKEEKVHEEKKEAAAEGLSALFG